MDFSYSSLVKLVLLVSMASCAPISGSDTVCSISGIVEQWALAAGDDARREESTTLRVTATFQQLSDIKTEWTAINSSAHHHRVVRTADIGNNCEGIESRELDRKVNQNTMCPWSYECDYDEQRIPAYIFHTKCATQRPLNYQPQNNQPGITFSILCQCKDIVTPMKVLKFKNCTSESETGIWEWQTEYVKTGCICINSS